MQDNHTTEMHDRQIISISKNIEEFLNSEEKSRAKINMLEQRINNVQNYINRDIEMSAGSSSYNTETKHLGFSSPDSELFSNYIRKGLIDNVTIKSLSSSEQEGGVSILPNLQRKILSSISAVSPMRQLASIETISSSSIDLMIEDGSFASGWIGEKEQRQETESSRILLKKISAHELFAQPKATQRLIDDSEVNIENWLAERLSESFSRTENHAFIHGDGNKKPFGILHNNGDVKKISIKNKLTPEVLLEIIGNLKEQYISRATFLINRTTLTTLQGIKDETGRLIWQPSISEKMQDTIFGIPVLCCSEMPAIENNKIPIVLADFKSAYKIVDRSNITIMRDPYTEKPFVKFYAVKRVGGDIINPSAMVFGEFSKD